MFDSLKKFAAAAALAVAGLASPSQTEAAPVNLNANGGLTVVDLSLFSATAGDTFTFTGFNGANVTLMGESLGTWDLFTVNTDGNISFNNADITALNLALNANGILDMTGLTYTMPDVTGVTQDFTFTGLSGAVIDLSNVTLTPAMESYLDGLNVDQTASNAFDNVFVGEITENGNNIVTTFIEVSGNPELPGLRRIVPEPTSLGILAGLAGLSSFRRRQRGA